MTPQAIIGWNNQVPIGYKPGSMSFMNFPREIRDQIYEDMLEEPQMTQYFKERGWQLSHKFNFAVLRLSKQVHKELSEIVYAKLWLVLPVIRIWGPEWANLNLGLPGTTHIRYCRIDFQILITYHRRQDRDTCKDGIMALIVDLVKTLSQLPNLEKLQVTHTGLVNYRLSNRIDPLDLEWEMNGFNFLKGLQRILPLGGSLDGPCYYTVLEFFKGMWRTGMRKHPRTDFQVEFRIRRQQDKLPSMTDSWEKIEGPDLSMIAEVPPSKVSSSDDSAVKPEGPDFSMLPELSASGDMPSTDDGMRSQGDSSISAGLVQLGIDNKSSTDDSASDTDSYAKTKKLRS